MDPLRLQQAAVKMFLAFFTARLQTLIANLLILIKSQVLYNFSVQIRRLTSNNILRFRSDHILLVQNEWPACRPIFKRINEFLTLTRDMSQIVIMASKQFAKSDGRQYPNQRPIA